MLDQETKRKIDNARDILVGKVPDPKSQVEQITIALIYKFMDDMDKESEEWGGKATFFAGEYKKYSWSKIFDPRLGGFDLIALYGDAIVKMNQNPNIPQLFRDIFKNAYLPYRDPETLKSFLKEINEFTYDHSEQLGNAFEYLLSVMDSQGDAGQFRTPRHIIDFIVEIVDPKKNETVLDPACGTAGFLISSYKHILKINTKDLNGDQLNPDERKRLLNNFMGYDISPDMVRLSLVNLYLHGFSDPKIAEYDTLTSEERWNETADVMLANPPFMTPKGGIRPHKRFSIKAKRSEVLFVDYIAEHLNPHGRAGVIVPEGIIFQSQTAYKNLRKMLVENYLWAVVSMPAGVFQPYSGVKTSILLIDKTLAKKIDKILFVKIDNDGFNLGAQRKSIDKNDLPKALEYFKDYQKNVNGREVKETDFAHVVEKTRIAESGEWNLSGGRYRKIDELRISDYELIELKEISEIISGQSPKGKYYNHIGKGIPFYQGKTEFADMYIGEPQKWTTQITKRACKGDVLMSVRAPVGPVNFATQEICIGRGLASIRPNKKIDKFFLFYFLKSIQDKIKGGGGAVFDSISRKQISEIKIPLPPLEIQKAIVAEIDSYQKIIDGARQVADNYKPTIKIDPDWEMVALEDLTKIQRGGSPRPIQDYITSSEDGINWIKIGDVAKGEKYITNTKQKIKPGGLSKTRLVKDGDFILSNSMSFGRPYIVKIDGAIHDGWLLIKIKDPEYLLSDFLYSILGTEIVQNQYKRLATGGVVKNLNSSLVSSVKIPCPPLSVQQEIVDQIEAEQKIVNANKKLIEMFEQKIKDKISEVWGE